MKTATFFAFFLAMFAMFCSASAVVASSAETALEKRAPKAQAAFDATIDLLVKQHSQIVVKAFADVCTDADVSSAIKTDLRVQISGLVNIDFGLGTKLSSALHASIKAAVKAEVNAQIKTEFSANLKANLSAIIVKVCPKKDAACIKLQAKKIVKEAAKLTVKASANISAKVQAKLQAKIKAAVDLQIKKFSVNLLLIKLNVTGDVNVSKQVGIKFKATADVCAKACASIEAKEVIQIRAICSA
ncbi:hypothetical protein BG011_004391 [Mortierella polycephala]|uniref:Uncharacterized protein n=1 Tax=Mortierella polycephala TaxID=41804 RepID=A0A9P6QCX1_9FUNG|nr:hypothetical protein BG011_004391 [Mortierella polycephala]